jgi:hypothetical protein
MFEPSRSPLELLTATLGSASLISTVMKLL